MKYDKTEQLEIIVDHKDSTYFVTIDLFYNYTFEEDGFDHEFGYESYGKVYTIFDYKYRIVSIIGEEGNTDCLGIEKSIDREVEVEIERIQDSFNQ